jgi:hypothetical protein
VNLWQRPVHPGFPSNFQSNTRWRLPKTLTNQAKRTKNHHRRRAGTCDRSVAIQFFTHVFDKFSEKIKNSKKQPMKTAKKCIFDIFASFLAFSTSSQKNLNF